MFKTQDIIGDVVFISFNDGERYKDIGIKPVYHIMTLWTNKAAEADDHPLKGKEDWFPTKDFEGGTELESSKRVIQYLKSKVKRMT